MSEKSGDRQDTTPDQRWLFDSGADLADAEADGEAVSTFEHLGWEGLALYLEGDRDDDESEANRALDQLRVTSLLTVRGMRFWLSVVKGISKVSSLPEIMAALDGIDVRAYDAALTALGLQMEIDDPTWGKVLAHALVTRPGRSDPDELDEILAFLELVGEDKQEFLSEFARRSVFGTGTGPRILASADDQDVSGEIVDAVKGHMKHLLREMRKVMEAPLRTARTKPENLKEQRSLDRLAWVLCNLERSRECVAIATSKLQELHIFANIPDQNMDTDLLNLAEVADTDLPEAQQATKEFYQRLLASGMGARGRITDQTLIKAERRLRKTITYLGELKAKWTQLKVEGHTGRYGQGRDAMVHAEAGAADLAFQQSKAIQNMPDLEFQEMLLNQEGITRRIEDLEVMIGISKLCCFHCLLLIRALGKVAGIDLAIAGTHFNTYNWPVADVLSTPEVLEAFLGLDETSKSPYAKTLRAALATEEGRRAVIIGIKESKDLGGGDNTTDYISSEDEADDELALTLAKDEGAGQGLVRRTTTPRIKKDQDSDSDFEDDGEDSDDKVDDFGFPIKEKQPVKKQTARSSVVKRKVSFAETSVKKRPRTRSAAAEKRSAVKPSKNKDSDSESG
ncbi:hypothetical protein Acor_15100 [Acrocarpospora corrugata]|uniref:Uncharacterized protein n=1 Tax=Acrocarpospora corrugata TaxID=35763 RepID=A0A5M3VRM2_9ACTN|nr:hypothetical protein [Acrocarpospora corrugata]GER99446.1 hypothetical protein Acor_15100 [Acrocarpospora corrugata]